MVKSEMSENEKTSKPFGHIFEKRIIFKNDQNLSKKKLVTSLHYHILQQSQLELND